MTKISKIKALTKKHPTWSRVFLLWLEKNNDINITQLHKAFNTLVENKHLLSNHINIDYALSLLTHCDETNRDIVEKLDDKIQKILYTKKKAQFIASLKTKSYSHLFNQNVEYEINAILDNKISISVMKTHFFNKLARYKTIPDLLDALQDFKDKNIKWNKKYYLNKIKQDNLNIEILEKDNTLMMEVKDYKACKTLGSQAWCIVGDEKTFSFYTENLNRQYIYLNFDLPLENNESMIGFTVDLNGDIESSYLRDDKPTSHNVKSVFLFISLSQKLIRKYINSLNEQSAFNFICRFGLIKYYKEFAIKKFVNPGANKNKAIQVAAALGYIEIVKLLLEDDRVDPSDMYNKALLNAVRNEHIEIVKLLLSDNRVILSDVDLEAIESSTRNKDIEMCKLLLKDKQVDAAYAFRKAAEYGLAEIVKLLLDNNRIDPSAANNRAIYFATVPEIIKLLLVDHRVDPSIHYYKLMKTAAQNGYIEICKLLLKDKSMDPSTNNNMALCLAAHHGHDEVVKLLLKDKRVKSSSCNIVEIEINKKGQWKEVLLLLKGVIDK